MPLNAFATEMPETCADLERVHAALGYAPKVALPEGLARFVEWFHRYAEGR